MTLTELAEALLKAASGEQDCDDACPFWGRFCRAQDEWERKSPTRIAMVPCLTLRDVAEAMGVEVKE